MESGDLFWYSDAGPGILKSGIGIVVEDVLFLCPTHRQPKYHKNQKFRSNLQQLPIWDQTTYFCQKFPLHECCHAKKLRTSRKEKIGDDEQPLVKLLERKGKDKLAATLCQKLGGIENDGKTPIGSMVS